MHKNLLPTKLSGVLIACAVASSALGLAGEAPAARIPIGSKARASASGGVACPAFELSLLAERASSESSAKPVDEALVQAAAHGDVQTVNALLAGGASVNASVPGDGSPLIAAARRGRLNFMADLLARGARIDMGVEGDGNPLIAAAASGHLEAVKFLLDRGANIEAIVPGDENALMQASYHGHESVVRHLIGLNANVNSRVSLSGGYRTPLCMARAGGHRDVEQLLLAAGARH